ncbi:NAD(P)/FAD-dependent oxidoreductase [Naumannella halotolerans]|uniref:Sarcosine oxidase subunit beta n=1 Tax=Naumannella halotolerans TaxID=993414 RepID=A0A4R7JA39_9ACTN|nr:FAD-binding oxidoreductase [Naumannella halotolerans]TDT33477.1 sarcosine oxidase subunit beta [Naumannella halotolerans]
MAVMVVVQQELPDRAEVVVIGGGVIGTAVAHELARDGITDVVVLEAGEIGSGSSAKPLGGVRATFSDPANVELSAWSLRRYAEFEASFSRSIGLHQVGYLFLITDEDDLPAAEAAIEVQNAFGSRAELVDPGRAAELCPPLHPERLLAASWSPDDGFAQPSLVLQAYAESAAAAGVRVLTGQTVTGFDHTAGEVSGVAVSDRLIRTQSVICCAGAWSGVLARLAGIALPVEPVKRQIAMLPAPRSAAWPQVPFTLDLRTTMYFHNGSFGSVAAAAGDPMLIGISDPATPVGFDREPSLEWLTPFRAAAQRLAPGLAEPEPFDIWAGLYENTPDHNALIGRQGNFVYATGFSGHGFLQAPGVGRLVADLLQGRSSFMDPTPFSLDRFGSRTGEFRELHII